MKVAVIGAGPAGMCAAIAAAKTGCQVDLYDHNEKIGKKLFITGKGRCNLTNDRETEDFFDMILSNPKFLYSSLYTFTNDALKEMIEAAGCPLKTERGGRVFPVSDKSSDILKAFERLLKDHQINVYLGSHIKDIYLEDDQLKGIILSTGEKRSYDAVIFATGGVSYRATGSDGSGLKIAERHGHHIIPLRPCLVGIETKEKWPTSLSGLSLKNVSLKLIEKGKRDKVLFDEIGEMLFTHTGVSGPLVLSCSSLMKKDLSQYFLSIDLKPGLTDQKLDARILREFDASPSKKVENALETLLPKRLLLSILKLADLPADQIVSTVTKEQREQLVRTLKAVPLIPKKLADINTAIVTGGGIDVKEIDPGTMESKKIPGLYFAGEMIDVDAFTGGYNIQIAASTGYLAGSSAGEKHADCN